MKRRITVGRTRALIDWYVATRSVPVSPARSAAMSARAASSRLTIASAWRRSSSPASVIEIGARAAGALDELLADDPLERRDLLAHRRLRVAELEGGAPERARAGDGLERRQVAQLDAEPALGRGRARDDYQLQ